MTEHPPAPTRPAPPRGPSTVPARDALAPREWTSTTVRVRSESGPGGRALVVDTPTGRGDRVPVGGDGVLDALLVDVADLDLPTARRLGVDWGAVLLRGTAGTLRVVDLDDWGRLRERAQHAGNAQHEEPAHQDDAGAYPAESRFDVDLRTVDEAGVLWAALLAELGVPLRRLDPAREPLPVDVQRARRLRVPATVPRWRQRAAATGLVLLLAAVPAVLAAWAISTTRPTGPGQDWARTGFGAWAGLVVLLAADRLALAVADLRGARAAARGTRRTLWRPHRDPARSATAAFLRTARLDVVTRPGGENLVLVTATGHERALPRTGAHAVTDARLDGGGDGHRHLWLTSSAGLVHAVLPVLEWCGTPDGPRHLADALGLRLHPAPAGRRGTSPPARAADGSWTVPALARSDVRPDPRRGRGASGRTAPAVLGVAAAGLTAVLGTGVVTATGLGGTLLVAAVVLGVAVVAVTTRRRATPAPSAPPAPGTSPGAGRHRPLVRARWHPARAQDVPVGTVVLRPGPLRGGDVALARAARATLVRAGDGVLEVRCGPRAARWDLAGPDRVARAVLLSGPAAQRWQTGGGVRPRQHTPTHRRQAVERRPWGRHEVASRDGAPVLLLLDDADRLTGWVPLEAWSPGGVDGTDAAAVLRASGWAALLAEVGTPWRVEDDPDAPDVARRGPGPAAAPALVVPLDGPSRGPAAVLRWTAAGLGLLAVTAVADLRGPAAAVVAAVVPAVLLLALDVRSLTTHLLLRRATGRRVRPLDPGPRGWTAATTGTELLVRAPRPHPVDPWHDPLELWFDLTGPRRVARVGLDRRDLHLLDEHGDGLTRLDRNRWWPDDPAGAERLAGALTRTCGLTVQDGTPARRGPRPGRAAWGRSPRGTWGGAVALALLAAVAALVGAGAATAVLLGAAAVSALLVAATVLTRRPPLVVEAPRPGDPASDPSGG